MNIDYFYFFNHYYIKNSANKEWNSTIKITDLTPGKLYYMTGNKVDSKWKEYKTADVNTDLVALNSYYDTVRMSQGSAVFADIGLKKTGETEDFVPEFYGKTISYAVTEEKLINGSAAETGSVATVNQDGLVTPHGSGSAVVTTTITGVYGDTTTCTTKISIPDSIDQVPILENILVPAGESVDVYWYALNLSGNASNTMTTRSIFITI